jgi:hypothetical protein
LILDNELSYCKATSDDHSLLLWSTIGEQLNKQAKENPNKVVYIFPQNRGDDIQLTFLDVKLKAELLAQNFLEMGLRKGFFISIFFLF